MSYKRLFADDSDRISAGMPFRIVLLSAMSAVLALPAAAESHHPTQTGHSEPAHPGTSRPAPASHPAPASGAKSIGKFDDWTAATTRESGQPVCYAFTRAQSSSPALPNRGSVILTVTERASGRDAVAIEAGFTFAANAAVTVQVEQGALDFYTAQRNAFARDGKATVAAFHKAGRAIARSPGPKDAQVTDTFSLKGFGSAYAAIVKACPAK